MDYKNIKIQVEDHVATMSLARIESLNALSNEFAAEISHAAQELIDMSEVRVIILKSDARIFCAGLDLKALASVGVDPSPISTLDFPQKFHYLFECCNVFERSPKPVIAAVHGKCVGGGLDMVAACDIRLCTEDASFSLREVAIGLVADMGVLQRLPPIIGEGLTKEMAFTARFYSAEEAERMKLVNGVYADKEALMEAAKELATQIAGNAPLAVQETKNVIHYSRNKAIDQAMLMAVHKNMILFHSEDLREAMTAFVEKRQPKFSGK